MIKALQKFRSNYECRKVMLEEQGLFSYLRGTSGYVLIIILILTTLLVSISSEFIVVAQNNIGYGQKLKNKLRASYLAKSGVQLCQYILYADLKGVGGEMITGKPTDKDTDSYNDIWAINVPEMPISDGSLKLQIIDENSKINLNIIWTENAERTKMYAIVQNFFINMGLLIDYADIICDWVDIDDQRMPYGSEGPDYYQTLTPPYPAKNNGMDSIDEMLLMKSVTPMIYYGFGGGNFETEKREQNLVDNNKGNVNLDLDKIQDLVGDANAKKVSASDRERNEDLPAIGKEKSRSLSEYFTVYGDRQDIDSDFNKININTASYRVLSALTDKMTPDIVTEIIRRRLAQPYKSIDEIRDLFSADFESIKSRLSVKSSIFRIIATANVDDVEVKITAVYNRAVRGLYYWCEE